MPEMSLPGRVVDRLNQGWIRQSDDSYHGYDPTATARILEARPLTDIEREFGPVRPVQGVPVADRDELRAAMGTAGRKAVGSLASALELINHEARVRGADPDGDPRSLQSGYRFSARTLVAGRPGSWESEYLQSVVHFGSSLNLHPRPKGGGSPDEMRATGPNRRRVDVEARDRMAEVLRRWTDSPDGYVEVAENLAAIVSGYADETYGADGWAKIADQWLQPGGLAREDIATCYGLLYSTSSYFNPSAIG